MQKGYRHTLHPFYHRMLPGEYVDTTGPQVHRNTENTTLSPRRHAPQAGPDRSRLGRHAWTLTAHAPHADHTEPPQQLIRSRAHLRSLTPTQTPATSAEGTAPIAAWSDTRSPGNINKWAIQQVGFVILPPPPPL